MNARDAFLDTNVPLYLLSSDPTKADRAETIVAAGGVISVQVLNEFVSVASRKLRMSMAEIREVLSALRAVCTVVPVTIETHDLGFDLAERFGLAIYDALIVAAALLAKCRIVYSEDLQDGRVIDGLTIKNPFAGR